MKRCSYHCTGESYHLSKVAEKLKHNNYIYEVYDAEVVYSRIESPCDETENSGSSTREFEVMIFNYGCVVFWNATQYDEALFLKEIQSALINPLDSIINDRCHYTYGEMTEIDEENDMVTLDSTDPMLKISLSYGFSQSVKLDVFEEIVERTIITTEKVPKELMKKGRIRLSRKGLAKKMGELFAVKHLINLHSTILDTPEFFWRKPKYETFYNMAIHFLDIPTRIEIINKRVDVLHELYLMLSNEQQHLYSSRLEITIILLIFIEILLALFKIIG